MPEKMEKDGKEIEVFTAEELEAQKKAAIDEYKTNNPDKSEDIQKLEEELGKKTKELESFKDKDFNLSTMRKGEEKLKEQIANLTKEIDQKVSDAKREVLDGVMKDHFVDTMNLLVGDDKDLLAKVQLKYDNDLKSVVATSKEEISRKLKDAFILATGAASGGSGVDNGAIGSGSVGRVKVEANPKFNDDELDLLKKLGDAGGMKIDTNKYK